MELTKLVKIMEGIRQPNVVIYLKLTDESESSLRTDFGSERYETTAIQSQVIRNFDRIFENEENNNVRILKIDASQNIEKVAKDIWSGIEDSNVIGQ